MQNEVDGGAEARSMEREIRTQVQSESRNERDRLGDPGLEGRIILKQIFKI
jgi:hypothetical protein